MLGPILFSARVDDSQECACPVPAELTVCMQQSRISVLYLPSQMISDINRFSSLAYLQNTITTILCTYLFHSNFFGITTVSLFISVGIRLLEGRGLFTLILTFPQQYSAISMCLTNADITE